MNNKNQQPYLKAIFTIKGKEAVTAINFSDVPKFLKRFPDAKFIVVK